MLTLTKSFNLELYI